MCKPFVVLETNDSDECTTTITTNNNSTPSTSTALTALNNNNTASATNHTLTNNNTVHLNTVSASAVFSATQKVDSLTTKGNDSVILTVQEESKDHQSNVDSACHSSDETVSLTSTCSTAPVNASSSNTVSTSDESDRGLISYFADFRRRHRGVTLWFLGGLGLCKLVLVITLLFLLTPQSAHQMVSQQQPLRSSSLSLDEERFQMIEPLTMSDGDSPSAPAFSSGVDDVVGDRMRQSPSGYLHRRQKHHHRRHKQQHHRRRNGQRLFPADGSADELICDGVPVSSKHRQQPSSASDKDSSFWIRNSCFNGFLTVMNAGGRSNKVVSQNEGLTSTSEKGK